MFERLLFIIILMLCCGPVLGQAIDSSLIKKDTAGALKPPVKLNEVQIRVNVSPVTSTSISSALLQQQLEMSKGSSLGEVLKAVSGVSVLKTGSTISKPVIHGLHSNRLLILNNGVRLEGQAWGAEHAPEIDPLVADKIYVIKGAESVRYGAEAIGGVVLVAPAELPYHSSFGGDVSLIGSANGRSFTGAGMLNGNLSSLPGFAWRLQGSVKRAGNVKSADYYLGNTGVREFNYSASLGYKAEKANYEAYYSQFSTTLGILYSAHAGTIEDIAARITAGRPLEDYGFTYDITAPRQRIFHHLLKLKATYVFENRYSLNVVYGLQKNHRKEFDFRRGDREALPITDLVLNTHTADVVLEKQGENGAKRLLGFNGVMQINNNIPGTLANTFIPNFDSFTTGLFLIQKWVKDTYELEAGLRYDFKLFDAAGYRYLQQEGAVSYGGQSQFHNVTGSMGLLWKAGKHWKIGSNAGIAWRAPTANELFSNGLHHGAGLYEIGDPEMKSEQGYKWINSVKYFTDKLSFEVDFYTQYLHNYIYTRPALNYKQTVSGTYPVFNYQQTNALFTGADLSANYQFLPSVSYGINAALVRAKDITADKYLPYIPSDRLSHYLKLGLPDGSFTENYLRVGHEFVDRQKRYEPGTDYTAPPPAYHLFNFMAGTTYHIGDQVLLLNMGIDNLFNKNYKEYMNRYRYYAHDMGRNITIRLNYKF